MTRRLLTTLALFFLAAAALAQQADRPCTLGSRFTTYDQIQTSLRRSPFPMEQIGETYEHRPLFTMIATSQQNLQRLDEIRRDVALLANGEGDVERLAKNTP